MNNNKKFWFAIPLLASALLLGACGSSKANDSAASADGDAKEIIVGTGNEMLDIAYLNKDNELDGYDIELLKAIDKKLPDIKFKFQTMDFANLLLSLQSNKVDMVAHNMAKNKEREEKFLFNKQPYNAIPTHVVVNEKNTTIKSIDDLDGKTVGLSPTSNSALFFEEYKKEHNLNTKITYIANSTDMINQLKSGRIDAIFSFPFSVKANNEAANAQQKIVGDELLFTDIYFLFDKKETALSDEIDGAIKELIKDGTVSELLKKWFGEDYSNKLTE